MKIRLVHGEALLSKTDLNGWYLESILVEEPYRNRGVGKRLMMNILKKCSPPIYLYVSDELGGNVERLTRFYESFGFETVKGKRDKIGFNYNMVRY